MIDWLVICVALVIITALVGIFGFVAWKINMSDPLIAGKKDDTNPFLDSVNDKQKKNKSGNESGKKKRKDLKKPKRDNKEGDHDRHSVTFKEPSPQTSEETDNEREESEQESSTQLSVEPQLVQTSTKARKRVKKQRPSTPPRSSGPVEGILANKDEKSPVSARAQPLPHPKLPTIILHDEIELAKQQQAKAQVKPSQASNKQPVPAPPAPVKKPTTNANQVTQKQQQQQPQQQQQEQPFTTVGSGRHKAGTPPSQQQQQQIKSVNTTSSTTVVSPPPPPPPPAQPQAPVQSQHEQLAQRQPPRQQKETPTQLDGFNTNPLPIKQSSVATAAPATTRLADLVKALPTSQTVVTELMSALDAFPLSTDELDIIMHKIANKQSVIKQDWAKLQHGQKVDPQAHIGQILDESARAYEEDMKNNAMKRIIELTDERNNDKRRIAELVKETNEKDNNLQVLRVQLNSVQHPQQQLQSYQVEFKRLTEENMQLKQRLSQQHQQLSSLNLTHNNNNNNNDSTNVQVRVLTEQIKKLSVDNGNLEKQLNTKDLVIKEAQKEKDDLLRSNQQLIQKVQESQKQLQHNEEKLVKELNENRTLHMNQLNDHKRRIEQLESDNERLRREEIVHVEPTNAAPTPPPPTLTNEEREKFEQDVNQLTKDNEQYKTKLEEIQAQYQSQERELRQEIEQLKKASEQKQHDETQNNELEAKNAQIDALRLELEEAKTKNDSINLQSDERLRQEQEKQKQFLVELIGEDVRNQLPNDSQDLNQWLSSYQQLFTSNIESIKRALQDEAVALKRENGQLHKNMTEVESQLREIEQTVQSKEESLITELKSKDATLGSARGENDQLNGEIQRLRAEIDRLQLLHETATNETRALKLQLNERSLVTDSSSSNPADESFEFVKQPSPPPAEIDNRAEQLNELIRSSKEALENQDSIVQQMDKHLNEMHRGGTGEISTSNVDEPTVSSSSSDQPQQSES
jgi:hypothetical protein